MNTPRETYTVINEEANRKALNQLTSPQYDLLHRLQKNLEQDFPLDCKDICMLVRHLRAKQWSIHDAETQFRSRMQWINSYKPHQLRLDDPAIQRDIASSKAFWFGRDKKNRPIFVYRAEFHKANTNELANDLKFFTLLSEHALHFIDDPPNDLTTVIYDVRNASYSSIDLKLFEECSKMLDYYPDMVGNIYIYGANWLIRMFFWIAEKLLNSTMLSRIVMLSSDDEEAQRQISQFVDKSQLLPSMGGTNIEAEHFPPTVPRSLLLL